MKSWRGGGSGVNKPKTGVVLFSLLIITLLAAAVCALHWMNAVSLRGTTALAAYRLTDGAAENLVAMVDEPWMDEGVLHISGALLRMNQQVGEVNVRTGLIAQQLEAGAPAQPAEQVILLNTQMVRRQDLAQEYGCDDHCGFHAAVDAGKLEHDHVQYLVVLVDETCGAKRMLETGLTIKLIEGGLAYGRVNEPEGMQHAQ